jgi:hypothetical protein
MVVSSVEKSNVDVVASIKNVDSKKDLLDHTDSRTFWKISSIQTFDFSTLDTTIPHSKN